VFLIPGTSLFILFALAAESRENSRQALSLA
jgi:hypothetical protein